MSPGKWTIHGLGHCGPLEQHGSVTSASSLQDCLRRCERRPTCRFASFLDADVLRRRPRARGACRLAWRCTDLRASTPGAVTYRHRHARRRVPRGVANRRTEGDDVATLALATPFESASSWLQLACASDIGDSVGLSSGCQPWQRGLFYVQVAQTGHLDSHRSSGMLVRLRNASGATLCGDGGRVSLRRGCRLDQWEVSPRFWDLSDPRRAHTEYQACVRLRLAGGSAHSDLVARNGTLGLQRLLAVNSSRSCWVLGFRQPTSRSLLCAGCQQSYAVGDAGAQPIVHVWLLASKTYGHLVDRMLETLAAAGDAAHVHIRWADDMRDASQGEWDFARTVFGFNLRKLLVLHEAHLESLRHLPSSATAPVPAVVLLDLDVVLFGGWADVLRACVVADSMGAATGAAAGVADACFIQQPLHPFEVANCGAMVSRAGSPLALALAYATLARTHSIELFNRFFPGGPTEVDQNTINLIMHRVRRQRCGRSLRWGIYSPVLVRVGPMPSSLLSVRLAHVTYEATLEMKLRDMDGISKMVQLARQLCGPVGKSSSPTCSSGAPISPGPQLPMCLACLQPDPHFEAPLRCWRLYEGFESSPHHDTWHYRVNEVTRNGWVPGFNSDLNRPESTAIVEHFQDIVQNLML